MATTQKTLAFGTLTGTALTEIWINAVAAQVQPFLVITNASVNQTKCNVYINSGAADRILTGQVLPGGIGKNWRVVEMYDLRLSGNSSVKLELPNDGTVNYFLSGIEITNA